MALTQFGQKTFQMRFERENNFLEFPRCGARVDEKHFNKNNDLR